MMEPLTVLLILIFFAIGFITGDQGGRIWNKSKQGGEESPIDPDARSVLRVWKKEAGEEMTVELEGKPVKNINFINYRQREAFNRLLEDLFLWAGRPFPRQAVDETAPQAAPADPGTPIEIPPESPAVLPSLEPIEAAPNPRRAGISPVNILVRALDAEVRKKPLVFKSIAGQIDDVLQEKLAGTPLEKRGIHLVDLPDQSVGVTIGLDKFEGVDNVPDEEVRGLIREAVSEWERRTRTG